MDHSEAVKELADTIVNTMKLVSDNSLKNDQVLMALSDEIIQKILVLHERITQLELRVMFLEDAASKPVKH
jgi:hypothetical protein